jgi:hypothetical protein
LRAAWGMAIFSDNKSPQNQCPCISWSAMPRAGSPASPPAVFFQADGVIHVVDRAAMPNRS